MLSFVGDFVEAFIVLTSVGNVVEVFVVLTSVGNVEVFAGQTFVGDVVKGFTATKIKKKLNYINSIKTEVKLV